MMKKQKGGTFGAVRTNLFDTSGNLVNLAKQILFSIENTIAGVIDGVSATYSVVTLPSDIISITDAPNEPLPQNTPISRAIHII